MWPILKTKMLIYQSRDTLGEKIVFGKITYHFDTGISKMLVKGICQSKDSTFHSGT